MNLNADLYLNLIRGGAAKLAENRETINNLNVFPIPDGDTGDNMLMTIQAGCEAAESGLGSMANAVAHGMLLGARGNSGVILSRIFAGMAKGLNGVEEADINAFVAAMKAGVTEAYQAVAQPVEGTILTVLREGVDAAQGAGSIEEFFDRLIEAMDVSLEHTPELLDVLKKAGVVDSGGAGLVCIAEGMRAALHGEYADVISTGAAGVAEKSHAIDFNAFTEDSVLEFGYCTEFILRLQRCKIEKPVISSEGEAVVEKSLENFDESVIRTYLEGVGDSLVFFRDGSIIKVHVHTMDPGAVLSKCRQWGEFLTIKVENMTLQHHENKMDQRFKRQRKAMGIVSVATGEGLTATFRDMGADVVIAGGQTMNPPVEAFLKAFDEVSADVILVLPNNSNILLTAQQAAKLYKDSRVEVIPTHSLGEGYFAMANMDAEADIDTLVASMTEAASTVTTGQVSVAIRDCAEGKTGDYLGLSGKEILCGSPSRLEAASALAAKLDASSADILLIFRGLDAPSDEAEQLRASLEKSCPMTEVILIDGGQPVYDYILVLC
ncbi:MAG: DAK2 domain-containing protein [Bacteroidales bacterium]|nr:DAK2 domain-containing protein [Bacteroidales bacterium]